jgi:hypothetical protein
MQVEVVGQGRILELVNSDFCLHPSINVQAMPRIACASSFQALQSKPEPAFSPQKLRTKSEFLSFDLFSRPRFQIGNRTSNIPIKEV